jgi:two-component system nitrate/nitrite response regulator NarL
MRAGRSALSVVLADDHPIVLGGLRTLIQTDPNFEIVAVCSDGQAALQAIAELQPDLAVLDVSMPGLNGIEVLAEINARGLKSRVVFLTASAGDHQIVEAAERGAYGLILKDAAADMLLTCMQSVSSGRRWIPSDLVEAALQREQQRRSKNIKVEGALTPREREIVLLAAEGLSNKEIARKLGLSDGTIKIHLHNIYHKLGVSNRTALTALALSYQDQLRHK